MIPFSKYSGAGNDFVIVREEEASAEAPSRLARRICPRCSGVGVDGMALIRAATPGRIGIRFFNPDGSEFSTCGNGTRCVARYAADRLPVAADLRLVTAEGEIPATVSDDEVALDYHIATRIAGEHEVPFGGGRKSGWLVRIGTPHFVIPLSFLPEDHIEELCRPIRHHPSMGTDGANVDLVALADRGSGSIRTFERGVEGETLACGSGNMAAAVALHAAGLCDSRLRLQTRSGHRLTVDLDPPSTAGRKPDGNGPDTRHIRLIGPARKIFDGRFPGANAEGAPAGDPGGEPGSGPAPAGA